VPNIETDHGSSDRARVEGRLSTDGRVVVTRTEAAKLIGVHYSTVKTLEKERQLSFVLLDRRGMHGLYVDELVAKGLCVAGLAALVDVPGIGSVPDELVRLRREHDDMRVQIRTLEHDAAVAHAKLDEMRQRLQDQKSRAAKLEADVEHWRTLALNLSTRPVATTT
jgi:chromosome segregation ATPase